MAGTRKATPNTIRATATMTSQIRCAGFFSFLTKGSVIAPEPANTITGKATLKGKASQLTLGKGRSQPPTKRVTATEATTNILVYSARKKSAQRKPLYSVWKPATSSDSAS